MNQETKKIFLNNPQQEFIYTAAHTSVIAGGRRIGKSHGFGGPFVQRNTQQMPRSTGGIVGESYQQLLTRTLPGTLNALQKFGFKRDVHFFINKKPPKAANFNTPYIEPPSYDHSIIWYNGTIWKLISQDRQGTSNSMTLDWLFLDEAKFLDFNKLKSETFPANGGFRGHFQNSPWNHSMLILSDIPTNKRGSWFLKYKDAMDIDVIDTIHAIIVEIWEVKERQKVNSKPYHQTRLNYLRKTLNELRSIAVYYREWSSIENLMVLGEEYIRRMKRELSPLEFQTSIMSKRIGILKDGFYNSLSAQKHYYTAFDYNYLDNLDFDFDKIEKECSLQDSDVDKFKPLSIAFDYNANINWVIVGQQRGLKMLTLKSFFVKYDRKLRELVQDFSKYYEHHQCKEVVYYYDNTALGSNYAVGNDDFASVIVSELERHGWSVHRKHIGNPVKHSEKHLWINAALRGERFLYPMFNKNNNGPLILALETTGTRVGSFGFGKDKSGEKLAESEEDKLEHRTDGTDAWDTLFIGMNKFPHDSADFDFGSHFA